MVDRRVRRAYEVRFGTEFEPFSPEAPALAGVVDVHAHGHAGQQDPLGVSKLASRAGMRAILWKTIGSPRAPWLAHEALREALGRWAETEQMAPVATAFGAMTEPPFGGPTVARAREAVEHGAAAIWLPVIGSVRSLVRVGAPGVFIGETGRLEPMTEEQAIAHGGVRLVAGGRLRPEIVDLLHYVADADVALFFGHAAPEEALTLGEEVERIGFTRAVVDHPFSPIIDLDVPRLQQLAAAGVNLNWTYDELSPMLGIDPQDMVAAIQAVGPEHCLLSSDAGDPVMPHSVEAMRMMLAITESYGLPREAVDQMATTNPSRILGLPAQAPARAA
ncbi:MAG TPA: DUF6282 family protein [Chloroflexota bacterium]